ncbi:LCP family glycopolymer transferase [Streptomyces spirodelae]|uniref:LCP family glycopolymer transferase n=1 Tax=Streptomyces spirodelae TaxID=2812904 RepID=UPI001E64F85E|nr:LCP family protein [Streptomyces spirodelae]
MLVHLARGRERAVVISIPRDTLIDRPSCPLRAGGTAPARSAAMFNTAYAVGGLPCAVRTVERLGKVRVDHAIDIDFAGFEELVDALGGVEFTTDERLESSASGLSLDATGTGPPPTGTACWRPTAFTPRRPAAGRTRPRSRRLWPRSGTRTGLLSLPAQQERARTSTRGAREPCVQITVAHQATSPMTMT